MRKEGELPGDVQSEEGEDEVAEAQAEEMDEGVLNVAYRVVFFEKHRGMYMRNELVLKLKSKVLKF